MSKHEHTEVPVSRKVLYRDLLQRWEKAADARDLYALSLVADELADAVGQLLAEGELSIQATKAYEAGRRDTINEVLATELRLMDAYEERDELRAKLAEVEAERDALKIDNELLRTGARVNEASQAAVSDELRAKLAEVETREDDMFVGAKTTILALQNKLAEVIEAGDALYDDSWRANAVKNWREITKDVRP